MIPKKVANIQRYDELHRRTDHTAKNLDH